MRNANDYPEVEGYDTRTYEGGQGLTAEESAERERLKREAKEEAYEQARKELGVRFSHERLFWRLQRETAPRPWLLVPYNVFQRRLKNRPGGAPFSEDGRPLFDLDERYLMEGPFPDLDDES